MTYTKENEGSNKGFTMIEMTIVIAIIVVLSAVALPYIVTMVPNYRLKSASRDLVSYFQQAKLRAVKDNATVVLIFDTANDRVTVFVDNGPGGAADNWALDASEDILVQATMPEAIDMYDCSIAFNTFGFTGRGLPSSLTPGGYVRIRNTKSNYRSIVVNNAGRIWVEMSTDGVVWN